MTIEECYHRMHADYEDVLRRMGKVERVERFLLKLPQDNSFAALCDAMAQRNAKDAFRAAHSLKGICANLGLSGLYRSSSVLSDALRGEIWEESCVPLFEQVKAEYENTLVCIRAFGGN